MFIDLWGLMPTNTEAALISQHVYYATSDDFRKDLGNEFGGWVLIDIFTNTAGSLKIGVYSRTVGGVTEYVLANRGTQNNINILVQSWMNNIGQMTGGSPDIFESMGFAMGFVLKHLGAEVTMVGHSKGGGETICNALATNTNCITFNTMNPVGMGMFFLQSHLRLILHLAKA